MLDVFISSAQNPAEIRKRPNKKFSGQRAYWNDLFSIPAFLSSFAPNNGYQAQMRCRVHASVGDFRRRVSRGARPIFFPDGLYPAYSRLSHVIQNQFVLSLGYAFLPHYYRLWANQEPLATDLHCRVEEIHTPERCALQCDGDHSCRDLFR